MLREKGNLQQKERKLRVTQFYHGATNSRPQAGSSNSQGLPSGHGPLSDLVRMPRDRPRELFSDISEKLRRENSLQREVNRLQRRVIERCTMATTRGTLEVRSERRDSNREDRRGSTKSTTVRLRSKQIQVIRSRNLQNTQNRQQRRWMTVREAISRSFSAF